MRTEVTALRVFIFGLTAISIFATLAGLRLRRWTAAPPAAKKGRFVLVTSPEAASSGVDSHLDNALVASGWLSVRATDLAGVRNQLASTFAQTLSMGVLKQTDEQGLVALLAMHRALDEARLSLEEITAWGVVASARCPGRRRIAESLVKFREQGAWSASPHLIPHLSLHSLPGLISQCFCLHGPNIGSGGLVGSEREAFWAALALLHGERLPGVWIVLTAWDQEALDATSLSCQAVVLGLRRDAIASAPSLRFVAGGQSTGQPFLTVESLGEAIGRRGAGAWNLGQGTLALSFADARLEAAA